MRESFPSMTLAELGSKFGIGKETTRKVIRRLGWFGS
jgi:hypothetical protein